MLLSLNRMSAKFLTHNSQLFFDFSHSFFYLSLNLCQHVFTFALVTIHDMTYWARERDDSL